MENEKNELKKLSDKSNITTNLSFPFAKLQPFNCEKTFYISEASVSPVRKSSKFKNNFVKVSTARIVLTTIRFDSNRRSNVVTNEVRVALRQVDP